MKKAKKRANYFLSLNILLFEIYNKIKLINFKILIIY